jgi:high-affinity iron transporter
MLPTFVIGLREGLEASLIVSIVTTFLYQRGRRDLIRWVFIGIAIAVVLCAAVGVTLRLVAENLPQRQQEGLETVIGVVAVAMVSYMVVWMRRHSRNLKGQLEGAAADALAAGSGFALVAMAFLAVLREGFETAVFLLAAFNESSSGASAGIGATLGILVAVGLGYAIYRGGVKLNLSKFFRATGVVLVLVAAGLVVNAVHTAHEAGWLNVGQDQFADLSSIVRPGSVQSSLLTGMLGIQERPTVIEFVAWLVYLVPVGLYVGWPPGRGLARAAQRRVYAAVAAVGLAGGVLLLVLAPDTATAPPTKLGAQTVAVLSHNGDTATVAIASGADQPQQLQAHRGGAQQFDGLPAVNYTATTTRTTQGDAADGRPASLTLGEVAKANGGRLPLGAAPSGTDFSTPVAISYQDVTTYTIAVEPSTNRVLSLQRTVQEQTVATLAVGATQVGQASRTATAAPVADVAAAVRAARTAMSRDTRHQAMTAVAIGFIVCGTSALLLLLGTRPRRTGHPAKSVTPSAELASR